MAIFSSFYAMKSAGVLISEIDLSTRVAVATSTSGGTVFASARGTLDPYYTTSGQRFTKMYGNANPQISFGHDCALAFHTRSNRLWSQRVVNGALHAGMFYYVDRNSKLGSPTVPRLLWSQFPIGTVDGYAKGARTVVAVSVSADFVTSNAGISLSMTNGLTVATTTPVAFTTDHNTTMGLFTAAIQTALSTFGSGGQAVLVPEVSDPDPLAKRYVILVYPPLTATMTFSPVVVTGGSSQPVIAVDSNALLMTVFAENPGVWANTIGTRITNVDVGERQRFVFTFSSALTTSNSTAISIDGVAITPVVYATSSDATLTAIAASIAAHPSIASATVVSVPGATNNDRVIQAVAKYAGPGACVINSAIVTGGSSPPAIVFQETLRGRVPTNEFDFEIYDSTISTTVPIEKQRCTLTRYTNAYGKQTLIEQRINNFSFDSFNVRVVLAPAAATYVFTPHLVGPSYNVDDTINLLGGGTDGAVVFNSQIANAWIDAFANRDKYQTNILINSGYTSPNVQQAMVGLAEYRHDAIAVLDMPSDQQASAAAFAYRTQVMNIDSSFGALYTPDLGIQDDNSDEIRYIPPSGHVAAAYAFNDAVAAVFNAPAGLNRGKIYRVLKLRQDYDLGDRELLDPVNINCIIVKPSVGPVIMGENTLQVKKSILSAVHSRRLLNAIEAAYADALDFTALFEANNQFTRHNVEQVGYTFTNPIVRAGGLYDAKFYCNSDNNTGDTADAEQLLVDMFLKITPTAKQILLRAVLVRSGASFAEGFASINGTNTATARQ